MAKLLTKSTGDYNRLGPEGAYHLRLATGATATTFAAKCKANSFSSGSSFANKLVNFPSGATNGAGGFTVGAVNTAQYFWYAAGRSNTTDAFQSAVSNVVPAVGIEYSVVAVFDYAGDRIRIYIDGNEIINGIVAFGDSTLNPGATTSYYDTIGSLLDTGTSPTNTARQWDGWIGEVGFWNCDIGPDGVLSYHQGTILTSIYPDNLIAYYPMLNGEKMQDKWINRIPVFSTLHEDANTHPANYGS